MQNEPGAEQGRFFFHHDLARLNCLAESVTLLATCWLGRTMQASYLPDHAKEAYIDYLAYNYNRRPVPELARQAQLLAWRLDRQFSAQNAVFSVSDWYRKAEHLNALPPLPGIAAERRFMRYLALRDLQEFTAAFSALTPPEQLRPWVRDALRAAIAQNRLENAWENSITLWDSGRSPRPRTFIRARFHAGFWLHDPPTPAMLH